MAEDTRLRTAKWHLAIYRQAYRAKGELKYTRTWYYSQQIAGRRIAFPLGVDPKVAKKRAEEIYIFLQDPANSVEDATERFNPRQQERAQARKDKEDGMRVATIGDIVNLYLENYRTWELRAGTAKSNVTKLYGMLRRADAKLKGEEFQSLSGAKIDYSWIHKMPVEKLKLAHVTAMQGSFLDEADDLEDELRCKRNANSYYAGARSIFAKEPYKFYQENSLIMPDREAWTFLKGRQFKKVKSRKVMTDPKLVERILKASKTLKEEDPDGYRAFVLAVHGSLRAKESGHAKWSWFRVEPDKVALEMPDADGVFRPKGNKGRRVIFERWVYDELHKMRKSEGDYIIENGFNFDPNVVNLQNPAVIGLNKWLREQGITERLPYHNLRSWWFCAKVRLDGLLAAQQQGGHEDPKTTSDSYADNEMPDYLLHDWRPEWEGERQKKKKKIS
jgi:hypothetical protein